jgi:hypothetical protein
MHLFSFSLLVMRTNEGDGWGHWLPRCRCGRAHGQWRRISVSQLRRCHNVKTDRKADGNHSLCTNQTCIYFFKRRGVTICAREANTPGMHSGGATVRSDLWPGILPCMQAGQRLCAILSTPANVLSSYGLRRRPHYQKSRAYIWQGIIAT